MSSMVKDVFGHVMKQSKDVFHSFNWEDPQSYALWLRQTHYFVENSTRLVALTGARFPTERNDLHRRFLQHCGEEMGHEVLLVRDIKSLGIEFNSLKVYPETKALYQTQHYWIERVDPISFYGYLLYLEGLAANHARHAIERISKSHGADKLTFLKLHADEDEDHLAKAFKAIEKIETDESRFICENLELSCYFYLGFMNLITKEAQVKPPMRKLA